MTAIYFGPGLDILPIKVFDTMIHHFVYIDSMPYSEYGIDKLNPAETTFIPDFIVKITSLGYRERSYHEPQNYNIEELKSIHLTFIKGNNVVEYYFNTPFPQIPSGVKDELVSKIATAKFMIVSGYFPHKRILDYLSENENVIMLCALDTVYDEFDEEDDAHNFMYELNKNPERQSIFSNIILYHHKVLTETTFEDLPENANKYTNKYVKQIRAEEIIKYH